MRAQRVEIDAIRFQRRVQLHPLEWLRRHREPVVAAAVFIAQVAGLIEKAEVRSLDVEAHGGDPAFVRREMGEDRREQEFNRAGLRGESRYARDVEMRRFGPDEKIGIE